MEKKQEKEMTLELTDRKTVSVEKTKVDIDQGWAWMVLLASFTANFLIGILGALGLFNVIFLDVFGATKAATSIMSSLTSGIPLVLGPLSGAITNKFGPRVAVILGGFISSLGLLAGFFSTSLLQVTLSFGVLLGIGLGLVYTASNVVLSFYFVKYRIPAYGIVSMGVGVGSLFFAILVEKCFEIFTWRGTMLLCSGFFLHMVVAGFLMRPVSYRETLKDNQKNCKKAGEYFDVELLWNKPFVLYWFNLLLIDTALGIVLVHLPASAIKKGSTFSQTSMLVFLYSCSNILSRAFTGVVASFPRINKILLYSSSNCIAGILLCLAPFCLPSYAGQITFTVCFSFFANIFAVLMAPIAIDTIGLDRIGSAYGLMSLACGIGFGCGPILAGWLYDVLGSYDNIYYISGALYIIGSVLIILIPIAKRFEDRVVESEVSNENDNFGTTRSLYQENMSKCILHGSSLMYIPLRSDTSSISSQRNLANIMKSIPRSRTLSHTDYINRQNQGQSHKSCGHLTSSYHYSSANQPP